MSFNRKDAWKIRTKRSGFSFSNTLLWLFAAQWWGIDPEVFARRDGSVQSMMVAAYEAHAQIDAILAVKRDAESRGATGVGRAARETQSTQGAGG